MKNSKNGSDRRELLREYSVKISHDESPNGIYWNSHDRFLWTVTLLLGCMCVYAARTVMPLCVVAIGQELHWDKQQSGTILSTFFWGYATTQLIGGHFADKMGGDLVLAVACSGWAGLTLLTPLVPNFVHEPTLLLFAMTLLRVLIGVCQGVHYPSVTSLISKNVDVKHRSFAFSAVVTGSNLGTLLCGSVGSFIVESQGWKPTFVFVGSVGAVWGLFLYLHMSRKQSRRRSLLQGKRKDQRQKASEGVPWRTLLKAPAFWSCIVCHMSETNCFFILLSWLPSYFHDKFPDARGWVFNVVPWLVSIPCSFLCGWLADSLISKGMTVTRTRKLMETVALLGASIILVIISYTEVYELSVGFMALAVGCLVFHHAGCLISPQDMAPDHAGTVFGVMNMCGAVPGFVGVYVVGYILEQTNNWSYVFVFNAVVTLFGWLVFVVFGTGEKLI